MYSPEIRYDICNAQGKPDITANDNISEMTGDYTMDSTGLKKNSGRPQFKFGSVKIEPEAVANDNQSIARNNTEMRSKIPWRKYTSYGLYGLGLLTSLAGFGSGISNELAVRKTIDHEFERVYAELYPGNSTAMVESGIKSTFTERIYEAVKAFSDPTPEHIKKIELQKQVAAKHSSDGEQARNIAALILMAGAGSLTTGASLMTETNNNKRQDVKYVKYMETYRRNKRYFGRYNKYSRPVIVAGSTERLPSRGFEDVVVNLKNKLSFGLEKPTSTDPELLQKTDGHYYYADGKSRIRLIERPKRKFYDVYNGLRTSSSHRKPGYRHPRQEVEGKNKKKEALLFKLKKAEETSLHLPRYRRTRACLHGVERYI